MPRKKMWVEWDDGAELSQSQKRPGQRSPLTRDGDNNLGHATLSDVEDDDDEWWNEPANITEEPPKEDVLAAAAGTAVILGGLLAVQKISPHARRLWAEKARPALKRSGRRLPGRRVAAGQSDGAEAAPIALAVPVQSEAVVLDSTVDQELMSSSEAQQRRLLAFLYLSLGDEQLRRLRQARIVEDGRVGEPAVALELLSPAELALRVRLVLEARPSWLDADTATELERLLEERRTADPVTSGQRQQQQELPPPAPGTRRT